MSEMPLGLGSEQLWRWSTGISIPESERAFSFSSHLFDAPVLCFAIALVLLILRLLIMRIRKVSISGTMVSLMDRALSRMIGTALVFAALGILWLAGCWLNYTKWGTQVPAGGALVSGGAFALLRNWIGRMGPAKKGGVMDIVKPLIPQILAYVAIALTLVHIYLGTIGMIDAYRAMRYGYVDESWAKHHHLRWYEEVTAGRARQKFADPNAVPPPATQPRTRPA